MIPENIIRTLKSVGVNFFTTLPCEKVRSLYNLILKNFSHVPLSREEEGVGICAGASLAGAKPAMLVQSSGVGNMVNALCSLTIVYRLPLSILVSWRGVYREEIPAQIPMGASLPSILRAIGVRYMIVKGPKDIQRMEKIASSAYKRSVVTAFLLNPKIWERIDVNNALFPTRIWSKESYQPKKVIRPGLTRFEIIKTAASYLDGKAVVCNLGYTCRELYAAKHQASNFYMLGSMGLASPIGLGVSLFTKKDVVVIDGDGSLLMNPGILSTIAVIKPRNLTILAIDNGVHGSTGNQPTATSICVDLEAVARGFGLKKTYKVASRGEITSTLERLRDGPNFVHILAKLGNAEVPNVPLTPEEIKRNFVRTLQNGKN